MHPAVSIRQVETHAEYAACEELSRAVWGAADRNVVPRELLLTVQLNGGQVQGAFTADASLVGFVFGFLGRREDQLRLCSHQLAVRPEYRGRGIGVRLKLAQRDEALRRGLELITWTFDPLEARNAYLNLHRLGAIARRYERDHYGVMDDTLNRGLPSDRLEAEWWITRPGRDERSAPTQAAALLSADADEVPMAPDLDLARAQAVLIQVPTDFQELKRRDPDLARRWRLASRSAFEAAIQAGLQATDFRREGAYVLEAVG